MKEGGRTSVITGAASALAALAAPRPLHTRQTAVRNCVAWMKKGRRWRIIPYCDKFLRAAITPVSGKMIVAAQFRYSMNEMLKIILVMPLIFGLISCASRQAERQAVSQPARVSPQPTVSAEDDKNQIMGQTIYVPVYSHIYTRDKSRVINLSVTLSVRNTDAQNPIRINSVRYYDTHGALLKEYLDAPLRLGPMASTDFVVAEDDTSGGAGANFIVEWGAAVEVTQAVVEAVMISTASQQGISFVSEGRVIKSRAPQTAGK